jgi:t-SNARE complex subunit (syntaxin)
MVSSIHKNIYEFSRSISVLQSSFCKRDLPVSKKYFATLVVCIIVIVAVMVVVAAVVVFCIETSQFYFVFEKFML